MATQQFNPYILNPYVTNIVPLYNVTSQASGPLPVVTGLSNIQTLLNFSNKSLSINSINSYTANTNLKLSNNTDINGNLTVNSYLVGPNNFGVSLNTCKQFIVSTPTTTISVNTRIGNSFEPNFNIYVNNINALSIDSEGNVSFSKPITAPVNSLFEARNTNYDTSIMIQLLENRISTLEGTR
jgi:hypothetical protein